MPKPRLHVFGKHMGDFGAIYNVLNDSNEYNLTYEYGATKKRSDRDDINYVISAHRNPRWWRHGGKIIHAHHGLGCIPKFRISENSDTLALYKRKYYALCVYGKVWKSWLDELGYPSERVLVIGMPASIELLSPIDTQRRGKFLCDRGLDPTKKTALYAPTWNHDEERGFFYLWWQDGKEKERVEEFCRFITCDLNMNLIVRLHQEKRYSQNWIKEYRGIFDTHKVYAHYLDLDSYNLPYFKYSDILVGDLSNVNTYFYVMDKPVIHIGADPFKKKRGSKWGGMKLKDRAGYITEDFDDLLIMIKDSVDNPVCFSAKRKMTVDKYIDYVGEDSKKAVLREFRRLLS